MAASGSVPILNPWLVRMGWVGVGAFALGLLVFYLGRYRACDDCEIAHWEKITSLQVLGLTLVGAALVTWAVAAGAAAIGWQIRQSRPDSA